MKKKNNNIKNIKTITKIIFSCIYIIYIYKYIHIYIYITYILYILYIYILCYNIDIDI